MLITFSCSSDDPEPASSIVSCQIGGTCIANAYTAEQCAMFPDAVVVPSCGGSSSSLGGGSEVKVPCEIGGVCIADVYTVQLCLQVSGTIVGQCSSVSSSSLGGVVEVKVPCEIGGVCIAEAYTAQLCLQVNGTIVGSCPIATPSSSSNIGTNPSSSSTNRSSSSSSLSSSSSGPYTGQWYCDYGTPYTDEPAGCKPVANDSDCDPDYGKLVAGQTECGKRTDITYCNWGPPYYEDGEWQGGCWRIDNTTSEKSKCTNDYGNVVSACPNNTLNRPSSSSRASSSSTTASGSQYCFYSNAYCDIIGRFYIGSNAYAYFEFASDCTAYPGTVVTRAWCVTNDYYIRDN
jgi:hypothetical protein